MTFLHRLPVLMVLLPAVYFLVSGRPSAAARAVDLPPGFDLSGVVADTEMPAATASMAFAPDGCLFATREACSGARGPVSSWTLTSGEALKSGYEYEPFAEPSRHAGMVRAKVDEVFASAAQAKKGFRNHVIRATRLNSQT